MPTKQKERTKTQLVSIAGKVDRLGMVRAELKTLKSEEAELSEDLKEELVVGESIGGVEYTAKVAESDRAVINVEKVYKKLGIKKFLDVVNVVGKRLDDYLGKTDKDKCLDAVPKKIQTLSITRNK